MGFYMQGVPDKKKILFDSGQDLHHILDAKKFPNFPKVFHGHVIAL